MLKDNKKIYTQVADRLPNWNKESKSDLIRGFNKYRNTDTYLAEAYMASIMLKYWDVLNRYYRGKSNNGHIFIEDCYDWLTQAVIYTVNKHVWTEPYIYKTNKKTGKTIAKLNTLYNNPDGPNIALSKCITSMRLGFYQSSNYNVRKVNYDTLSLDKMYEDCQECLIPCADNDPSSLTDFMNIRNIIVKYFNESKFYHAFLLEGILNGDVFDVIDNEYIFNKKKLAKHLRHIDDNYCVTLADMFKLKLPKVIEASMVYRNIHTSKMYRVINKTLLNLKEKLKKEFYN